MPKTTPALDPLLNYTRYFVSVFALPVVMTEPFQTLPSLERGAVTLLETQCLRPLRFHSHEWANLYSLD